jgi:hypothetical protein
MTEQQWHIVAEVIQEAQTACEQALMERIGAAVHELNIPASVSERMQQVVTAAVARAFQADRTRPTCVTLLTRAMLAADEPKARSWGFFLVERGTGDGALYQIEVFVYPDAS